MSLLFLLEGGNISSHYASLTKNERNKFLANNMNSLVEFPSSFTPTTNTRCNSCRNFCEYSPCLMMCWWICGLEEEGDIWFLGRTRLQCFRNTFNCHCGPQSSRFLSLCTHGKKHKNYSFDMSSHMQEITTSVWPHYDCIEFFITEAFNNIKYSTGPTQRILKLTPIKIWLGWYS